MSKGILGVALVAAVLLAQLAAVPPTADAALPLPADERGVPTLAPLIEKVTPAVVNISVLSRSPVEENPLFRDPFFRRFFEFPERSQPQRSAGSGVIVDAANGYVLTNHHVIESATEIIVTLKDARSLKAKLVGSDSGTDVALLKIEAQRLTALAFGDSDELRIGDFVVAIGNPFGLGQTVTSGIVSALGRSGLNIEGYEDFIQTDASINPGNSGGALVSLKGELVGINTVIIGPAGGNVGIGFAVPSNMARTVMDHLVRYGEVRRGKLGVSIRDLTPEVARAFGIERSQGAVVKQVEPGSSAAQAGLRVGDVIVGIDGHGVRGASDLRNRIGLVRAGEEIELTLLRDGKRNTIRARVSGARMRGGAAQKLAGAMLRDLEPGMALYGKVQGALVAEIEPDSLAWQHGLRKNDIIVEINRERVANVEALKKVLQTSPELTALGIIRGNGQILILVR